MTIWLPYIESDWTEACTFNLSDELNFVSWIDSELLYFHFMTKLVAVKLACKFEEKAGREWKLSLGDWLLQQGTMRHCVRLNPHNL